MANLFKLRLKLCSFVVGISGEGSGECYGGGGMDWKSEERWEWIQVAVPGAKTPWEVLLLRIGLRECLNNPMIHLSHEKLETQLKQKRSRVVIHSSNEEEPSVDIEDSPKQGRMIEKLDKDNDVNLVSDQREVQEIAETSKDDDDATLVETLLNIRRSSAKDKGKGVMQETELPKKLKKKEKIQLSLNEEKEDAAKGDQAKKIDWDDPTNQGGYKQSHFKGMKYEDIRPIFKRVWDQVHTFVPKDFEIKKEVMKRAGFDLQHGSSKKQRLDQQTEETEKHMVTVIKR
nr:hypothetical protein [Tanacetum cinerariifolium]